MYGDFGGQRIDRDVIEPQHYATWLAWGQEHGVALDFNATCFAHPRADTGYTLGSIDPAVRGFWSEHVKRAREIAAFIGREQGVAAVHNLWLPDGAKDDPYDRWTPRATLRESLDEIFAVSYPPTELKDAVESKLFGIGSEAYVVGSHEFYLAYALSRGIMVCLDLGHFHPTEAVADKLSAILQFTDELLLHVSRGVRWDSDHVPIRDDAIDATAQEIVRLPATKRIHIALDFFDGSINRVGACVTGVRALQKALLAALLEPSEQLRVAEAARDGFTCLALQEEAKAMPYGAVWDHFCQQEGVPVGAAWIAEVKEYERTVLSRRT
jgi:L-rhamnose isomerase